MNLAWKLNNNIKDKVSEYWQGGFIFEFLSVNSEYSRRSLKDYWSWPEGFRRWPEGFRLFLKISRGRFSKLSKHQQIIYWKSPMSFSFRANFAPVLSVSLCFQSQTCKLPSSRSRLEFFLKIPMISDTWILYRDIKMKYPRTLRSSELWKQSLVFTWRHRRLSSFVCVIQYGRKAFVIWISRMGSKPSILRYTVVWQSIV